MKTPEERAKDVVAWVNHMRDHALYPEAIADAIREAVAEETRRIMALAEYTRAVGFVKSKGSEDQLPFSAIMALSTAKA
jgi:molybdopterin-guanine dinucleotide biosynthesis protein A